MGKTGLACCGEVENVIIKADCFLCFIYNRNEAEYF